MAVSPSRLRVAAGLGPGPDDATSASCQDVEAQLVARAADGDMKAWGRLYQSHFDRLHRHIGFLTGDLAASEDLVQEAFARAQASLSGFEGGSKFSTWLHGIALNVVRKHWVSRRRTAAAHELLSQRIEPMPVGTDLERQHLQKMRAAALYQVVESIPDHLREAFILRELEGLSVPETAVRLGLSEANVRVRAFRARARVHDLLVAEGWIEPAPGGSR